jgi:hypothetical protein
MKQSWELYGYESQEDFEVHLERMQEQYLESMQDASILDDRFDIEFDILMNWQEAA